MSSCKGIGRASSHCNRVQHERGVLTGPISLDNSLNDDDDEDDGDAVMNEQDIVALAEMDLKRIFEESTSQPSKRRPRGLLN